MIILSRIVSTSQFEVHKEIGLLHRKRQEQRPFQQKCSRKKKKRRVPHSLRERGEIIKNMGQYQDHQASLRVQPVAKKNS